MTELERKPPRTKRQSTSPPKKRRLRRFLHYSYDILKILYKIVRIIIELVRALK